MGSSLDPQLTEPQLSNRVIAALLHELDLEEGAATVDALLEAAGLPRAYLEDTTGWVSTAFVRRFATEVARRLHDLDALPDLDHPMWLRWRRAGQRALDPGVIGPIFQVLRAFGSPRRLYRRVPELAPRATRSTEFELRSITRGRAVIAAKPITSPSIEPWSCSFQHGFFEAVPTLYGLPVASVEHHECMLDPHRPAGACVYHVRFAESRRSFLLTRLALALLGGLGGGAVGVIAGLGATAWVAALFGATLSGAVDGWRRYLDARRHLLAEAEDLARLLKEADRHYGELWEEQVALRRSVLTARKLSGYLASDLVDRILEDPELELTLGGSETTAAVLFSDIVGFTPRCEQLEPAEVVAQLNVFFSHVDHAFAEHRGIIDKRMGDGIMAVFVPHEGEGPPVGRRAICCALDMLRHLERCNEQLAERGAEPFQIRLGVAAGPLVQGNMGSEVKLEYTVIGDIVNLASRLEGQATPGHVLVPHSLVDELTDSDRAAAELGDRRTITVKGRGEPVEVQELRPR